MKYIKIIIILILVCNSIIAFGQNIYCVDTVTSKGYFYQIKYKNSHSGNKSYYVPFEKRAIHIDSIYIAGRYLFKDTVKYLSYTPKFETFLKMDDQNCTDLYNKGIALIDSIRPVKYHKVSNYDKYHKSVKIGFSYVKVQWLHLRVIDWLASDYFDKPYTLKNPGATPKFYDIFIPLKVLEIDNKVLVKKGKITETAL